MRAIPSAPFVSLLVAFCFSGSAFTPANAMSSEADPTAPSTLAPMGEHAPVDLDAYSGTWIRIESEVDRESLREAIDHTADGLPLLMRGVSRLIMHRRIQPGDRYTFGSGADGEKIQVARDDEPPVLLQLDGIPHESVSEDGERVTRTSICVGGAIEAQWHREDSYGRSVYRVNEEGSALVVEVTIDQEFFRVPLVYRATYRRGEKEG